MSAKTVWISDAAWRNLDRGLRRDLLGVLKRDRFVGRYACNAESDLRALGEHELAGRLLEGIEFLPRPLDRS